MMSFTPPGANGTTNRSGRSGNFVCAWASSASDAAANIASVPHPHKILFINIGISVSARS
jgi:hypothetical protein